jgi:hypothetical protein
MKAGGIGSIRVGVGFRPKPALRGFFYRGSQDHS